MIKKFSLFGSKNDNTSNALSSQAPTAKLDLSLNANRTLSPLRRGNHLLNSSVSTTSPYNISTPVVPMPRLRKLNGNTSWDNQHPETPSWLSPLTSAAPQPSAVALTKQSKFSSIGLFPNICLQKSPLPVLSNRSVLSSSPVTVKLAPPDLRRNPHNFYPVNGEQSASVSKESTPGPCDTETVLTAIREKRKRGLYADDQTSVSDNVSDNKRRRHESINSLSESNGSSLHEMMVASIYNSKETKVTETELQKRSREIVLNGDNEDIKESDTKKCRYDSRKVCRGARNEHEASLSSSMRLSLREVAGRNRSLLLNSSLQTEQQQACNGSISSDSKPASRENSPWPTRSRRNSIMQSDGDVGQKFTMGSAAASGRSTPVPDNLGNNVDSDTNSRASTPFRQIRVQADSNLRSRSSASNQGGLTQLLRKIPLQKYAITIEDLEKDRKADMARVDELIRDVEVQPNVPSGRMFESKSSSFLPSTSAGINMTIAATSSVDKLQVTSSLTPISSSSHTNFVSLSSSVNVLSTDQSSAIGINSLLSIKGTSEAINSSDKVIKSVTSDISNTDSTVTSAANSNGNDAISKLNKTTFSLESPLVSGLLANVTNISQVVSSPVTLSSASTASSAIGSMFSPSTKSSGLSFNSNQTTTGKLDLQNMPTSSISGLQFTLTNPLISTALTTPVEIVRAHSNTVIKNVTSSSIDQVNDQQISNSSSSAMNQFGNTSADNNRQASLNFAPGNMGTSLTLAAEVNNKNALALAPVTSSSKSLSSTGMFAASQTISQLTSTGIAPVITSQSLFGTFSGPSFTGFAGPSKTNSNNNTVESVKQSISSGGIVETALNNNTTLSQLVQPSGGLVGQQVKPSSGPISQQVPASGFSFGANTIKPSSTSNTSIAATVQQNSSTFGAKTIGGFSFGTNQISNASTSSVGGFAFGSKPAGAGVNTTQQPTGGGMFGSVQTSLVTSIQSTPTGGFAFGSSHIIPSANAPSSSAPSEFAFGSGQTGTSTAFRPPSTSSSFSLGASQPNITNSVQQGSATVGFTFGSSSSKPSLVQFGSSTQLSQTPAVSTGTFQTSFSKPTNQQFTFGTQTSTSNSATGINSSTTATMPTFGQNVGAFGQTSKLPVFGQTAQPSSTAMFGQPSQLSGASFGQVSQQPASMFGQAPQTTSGTFGQVAQQVSTNMLGASQQINGPFTQNQMLPSNAFGQSQSQSSGIFGQPGSQMNATFSQNPTNIFGQNQTQSTGIFGQNSANGIFGQSQPQPPTAVFGQQSSSGNAQLTTPFNFGQQLSTSGTSAFQFGQPSGPAMGAGTSFNFGGGIAQSSPAFGAAAAGATAGSGVGSFTLGQTRTATRKVSARRRH